ncbi:olfactory receptor [Crotalus adamanteus]|uniref:Olfactory receptor n=1 Tax=Crotalus adamanteus TaxID=8729 RepID=A0AAW1B561_CROAD
MDNDTSEFFFWEFSKNWELQVIHIVLLLILYSTTITGNLFIITTVIFDHQLHTPMYFFLMNLAMQDIGLVSIIVPKAVFNSLMNIRTISYSGCIAQVMFFFFFLTYDVSLLTLMAYDRYIAICTKMIGSVWIASLLNASLYTIFTFITPFCSNIINQFYCEIPYLLKIACPGLYASETGFVIFSAILTLGCFIFVLVTYLYIFSAVLRIPSVQGRKKAFTTCLPHLTVFSIFMFTGCFAYLKSMSDSPTYLDFIITIMYSIIPSMMNPFIQHEKQGYQSCSFKTFWSDVISF